MAITLLMMGIVLIVLFIGAYTDIRTREVPDWVNYGLIFTAFGVRLIYSLAKSDWSYMIEGALGFAAFLALAYMMFYAGQWGGGDAKMIMGLGAMFGLRLNIHDFTVSFLVNTFLIGAIYGLIWSLTLAALHWHNFRAEMKKTLHKPRILLIRKMFLASAFILLALTFFVKDFFAKMLLLTFIMFYLATYYLWVFIKAIEKTCMYKLVPPEKLTEGDWIAKDIVVGGKRICGPKDLGIEMRQIRKLIQLKKQKKIDRILIKEGIPFVPSFLLAFIATCLYGNLFLMVVG